ncbi:MAG: exo-alpha-sialidase [Rhodocyclales bacterium]|nr:exo-alpha-sialidase [Rhodocyclales bacterium]
MSGWRKGLNPPLRSVLAALMVGALAGCGGGGGGDGSASEDAGAACSPTPIVLALSWQPAGFTAPEVAELGQPPVPVVAGDLGDVAVTPSGGVHLAWSERRDTLPYFKSFVSRSHDAGASWHGTSIEPASSGFAFLTTLASGRLVAGSTADLAQNWWRSPRLWWSDDDGVTWRFQDVRSDVVAPAEGGLVLSYEEEPIRVTEHNGKVVVLVRAVSTRQSDGEILNRLYYWDVDSATLTRLPVVPPQPGPLPARDDYEIAQIAGGANGYLYVGIAGEVLRTADGINWEALPRARSDANLTALTVLANGTLAAGFDNYANLSLYKEGWGWRQAPLPEDQKDLFDPNAALTRPFLVKQILQLHSGALLASTWTHVYASCDLGARWKRIEPGPGGYVYRPVRMAQGADGTVWGSFYTLDSDPAGTGGFQGLLKIQPPAGVAPRDFVNCL